MQIQTASWFTRLPSTHRQVGISRGVPRGLAAGYKQYRRLCPGGWFNSVLPDEYLRLYNETILGPLDPEEVVHDLIQIAGDRIPTMLCYEAALDIHSGAKWCHRHIVAKWLDDSFGIEVPEFNHPELDRFRLLRERGIAVPSYAGVAKPKSGRLAFQF